jgi:hypothetical protein
VQSELHPAKHDLHKNSTDEGIQSDRSDEQPENRGSPIRVSFEPDSKVNEESELQESKHDL